MKPKWLLIIGLMLISLAMPVMASSGSFDSVGGLTRTSYSTSNAIGSGAFISGITMMDIQNQTGIDSIFLTTTVGGTADSDSGTTAVNLYVGNTLIGDGQFGYTKVGGVYNVYLYFNSLNVGTFTGNHLVNFSPLATSLTWNLNNFKPVNSAYYVPWTLPVNSVTFWKYVVTQAQTPGQYYTQYQSREFHNTWTSTYSSPASSIVVTKIIGSMPYLSKVYVMQGTTVLASNTTLTSDPFTASIAGAPYFTINASDMWGNWYVSDMIYPSGTAPAYTISVLPATITTTTSSLGAVVSTIDTVLSAVTDIGWQWSDDTGTHVFYESGNVSRFADYTKKSGTWYGYDSTVYDFVNNKGTDTPNPTTLSGITSTGIKTIHCNVKTSDGNYYQLTGTLTVGAATAEPSGRVLIRAIDWRTDDQVIGAAINIKNIATGTWSNETTVNGRREFFAPVGSRLYLEAYKSGYDRANVPMYQVMGLMDSQTIPMFPTGSGSSVVTNTMLYVMVGNYNTLELGQGYSVRIVNDGQFKVTPASGIVSFTVLNGSVYTVSAGCSANQCYSGTKTETVSGSSYVMQFYLLPVSAATATPTLAPGHTATPTAVPTLDTRTNEQKSGEMVDFLYDNGYSFVVLCFIAAIIGVITSMGKR